MIAARAYIYTLQSYVKRKEVQEDKLYKERNICGNILKLYSVYKIILRYCIILSICLLSSVFKDQDMPCGCVRNLAVLNNDI